MSPSRAAVLVLATLTLVPACGNGSGSEPPPAAPGERVGSTSARVTAPAPAEDLAAAVAGNGALALDLYRVLSLEAEENLFFSPQSIAFALSMTYPGAAGETAAAFERTLHVSIPEPDYHRAMNDLDRQLRSRGAGAKAADGQPFRLRLVNQLFAQRGFAFEPPFLDVLAQEYGADVRLLDFASAPEPSRGAINGWVAQETEDRILDLLPQGTITTDTRAVLVNAIYFNAAWAKPFDPALTRDREFTLLDGSRVAVPTMSSADLAARAAQVDGVEVVELPYDGGELSMLLLVPPSGALAALEQALTPERLAEYVAALRAEHLALTLPRFEVRSSLALKPPLAALGLEVAFSELADLSRMSSQADLLVSDVVHQAFVKVNEAGTEAAAATAVIIGVTSMPTIRPVAIDRPFLFVVRDDATGALVFVGRVTRP
ncbi:serpin family protein [Anaeromyxobacter sp. Fw109-5]|uniref:serpin family protein n=1 Tax=Anaeromyxobacter sp. (strain Fw109-5) TaxID=404589 RepID=UPI0000ED6E3C|nr:serpin family protein [Anaeromyxobacter sp. Fw109-5]ABS28354.1 proteinase inhibitor I4 serpin [Anaeromyxobacter sp. Fw109-5]